jgi:hypothetical protein
MERKTLGRIEKASFGWGGYQDAMIGLTVTLSGESWGVTDHRGMWGTERGERTEWTEESRLSQLGDVCMWLRDILEAAKKTDVAQLAGTPIEATFDGNKLVSWRVLTEVL